MLRGGVILPAMKYALTFLALGCAMQAAPAADTWRDASPHRSGIVEANGIRLHYLDWGGSGQPVVFLAGLGNTAHVFDTLAPTFAKQFHAIGMTRRGFGQSDRPDTGYDVPTRVADLAAFLDALKIEKAILIGHSLAGDELAAFAMAHPARVIKLVFLDAAYDRSTAPPDLRALESVMIASFIAKTPKLPPDATPIELDLSRGKARFGRLWNESLEAEARENYERASDGQMKRRKMPPVEALREGTKVAKLDYAKLASPSLVFFSVDNLLNDIPAEKHEEVKDAVRTYRSYQERQITLLKNNPHAQVVVLPGANHYCWFDRGDEVVSATMKFLNAKP